MVSISFIMNLELVTVQQESSGAATAVDAVLVDSQADTSTAGFVRAILAGADDLAILVNLKKLIVAKWSEREREKEEKRRAKGK